MEFAFYICGLIAILATLRVVTHTNPVHALLYLIISLLAIAAVFFSLGAYFAGALEIIVYAGAIMVLFVFVVMMLNLGGTEIEQAISELGLDIHASEALAFDEALLDGARSDADALGLEGAATSGPTYFNLRKVSIWGGSNEIQRNVLAKHVLGL